MPYDTFNLMAKCPKCGSEHLTSNYDMQLDSIVRKCTNCSYTFHQLPLDRKDKPEKAG